MTVSSAFHGRERRIISRVSRAARATDGASLSQAAVSCDTSDGGRAMA